MSPASTSVVESVPTEVPTEAFSATEVAEGVMSVGATFARFTVTDTDPVLSAHV